MLYFKNFYVWFKEVAISNRYKLGQQVNCLFNCLFGGDPRVTISLRTQRNQDPISNLVNMIANKVFHQPGVKERPWGKDSDDDLNLPWQAQARSPYLPL